MVYAVIINQQYEPNQSLAMDCTHQKTSGTIFKGVSKIRHDFVGAKSFYSLGNDPSSSCDMRFATRFCSMVSFRTNSFTYF
ncbi:hypothetical protein VCRA2121O337_40059 [Vibrio crassostreae]|nr:hypothetical protein VCRA2120E331_40059 [Vibrio crassostreae]CAK3544308.1 hypothetical protein VCRA2120E330_40060 [Vibrio crassostreae]CAK3562000.1 hypothetical protein VCRA213O314_50121 [Vibrio crassostreae]CAK3634986.1 hypothetical protein VCRA2122O340_40060 [Vibrio crassostreae]CAK3908630.1 hypothetical protein VCRA2121O337_40059 [Vibrio crassostreae]